MRAVNLTFGSLFSGIGGLDLGLERAGWEMKWHSEIDPYCIRVHEKHWPDVPNLGDVSKVDWSDVERVDLICGGYPCQPFSQAGARRGATDERHLWPYMRDAIRYLRPRFVLIENVREHLRIGFDAVLSDLACLGFDAEWTVVSACALGAPHARERLFVLAYPQSDDEQSQGAHHSRPVTQSRLQSRGSGGAPRSEWWLSEPVMDRVAHGLPRRLVVEPLRAVGNAVVPQVAEFVGSQILADFVPQESKPE